MEEVRKIFDETLEQNKSCREAMLSLIGSREAIAFVGAGLSAHPSLKYPSWKTLIERLCAAANGIAPFKFSDQAKENLLLKTEEIWAHFESNGRADDFKSILGREYGPRQSQNCSSTHNGLVNSSSRSS
jgi:hypothetical protein